jgi:hypothetical protein
MYLKTLCSKFSPTHVTHKSLWLYKCFIRRFFSR